LRDTLRDVGIDAFRSRIGALAPFFRDATIAMLDTIG
jgi:hypothetical protein